MLIDTPHNVVLFGVFYVSLKETHIRLKVEYIF